MGPIDNPDIVGLRHATHGVCPQDGEWTIYGRHNRDIYALHRLISVPSFIKLRFPSLEGKDCDESRFKGPGGFITFELSTEEKLLHDEILDILNRVDIPAETLLQFFDLPWVSSVIEVMPTGPKSMDYKINCIRSHAFENSLISYSALRNSWGVQDPNTLIVSSENLKCLGYLNESVAIVSIDDADYPGHYIFKTNSNPQLLYQEIETIVRLYPHPNIIHKRTLVTKNTMISSMHKFDTASDYFELKNMPIIGFLVDYYPGGTLMSALTGGELSLQEKSRWCASLVSVMTHIRHTKQKDGRWGFYADLKPDNIIFSENRDLILIDFETDGSWAQYTPPEVLSWRQEAIYVEPTKSRLVFIRGPNSGETCMICSPHPCSFHAGSRSLEIFEEHMDIFEYKRSITNILARKNSDSVTLNQKPIPFWSSASDEEREQAMVYMMGCIFWCIIEQKKCISECQDRRMTIKSKGIPACVKRTVESCFLPPGKRPCLAELGPVFQFWESTMLFLQTEAEEDLSIGGLFFEEEDKEVDGPILASEVSDC
ncbi:hypothetical protein L873DRAFT_1793634 [Choiromyces venosus 120613-1]|uniref:Protein kinase domain-containing protein n=1 Tax=Choiromyces venosus 120613-1 TaxID=1336337 RepID=A0A3N4J8S3_9PEZI|nr:hypothetical protein L873DRAFT_1793634 [Choiromyces venosus 120613-1]